MAAVKAAAVHAKTVAADLGVELGRLRHWMRIMDGGEPEAAPAAFVELPLLAGVAEVGDAGLAPQCTLEFEALYFQRPHQGLDGLTPADRFFNAAPTVLAMLRERVASNALELARQGVPRPPFYVTGQPFSVHAEGERVFLTRPGQPRQEVELVGPPTPTPAESADQEAAEPLPEAVCPHGAPESGDDLPAPSAPGVSWYESPSSPAEEGGSAPEATGGAS
jgi:hypothetical protein